jgi:hypothetical protein
MLAWSKPKQERRRLINSILQMSCNFIFCFRAKEKLKIERGKDPVHLGFMPIAGEEFVYEMTLKCLLLPGANGIPTWQSEEVGERAMMIKLPEQFRRRSRKPQLTEDIGQELATWAAGAPHALRDAARRVIAARSAPEPGASDEPDAAGDDIDFDPETGEVHEPGDDHDASPDSEQPSEPIA